jgi:L-ascorbate metabolism protein UlaG (beta-lactamase superfamily)
MRITHFGHACVLVEIGNTLRTTTRILLDPGSFSTGLADLGPVDAVLVTHEHVDHVDPIGESVLHPGDCWTEVARPVDTLLLPIGGPWMKLAEAVEYVRRVRPRVAIPIHQQGLVPEHQHLHIGVLTRLAPEGTDVMALELGQPASI